MMILYEVFIHPVTVTFSFRMGQFSQIYNSS